jgi:hypothetical protein
MTVARALRRPAWILLLVVSCARIGVTAEFRLDPSSKGTAGAILEGKIEPGDFDRFKTFILKGDNPTELYLASPGGNLGEALKIGMLVRLLKLSTVVPNRTLTNQERDMTIARHGLKNPHADYMCSSACFFIFIAGIYRSTDGSGSPILGIHRPFLPGNNIESLRMNNMTVNQDRIRQTVERYLEAMDIPAKYSEQMFSVPKGKISLIRDDEFATDFAGFIPALNHWAGSQCVALIGEKTKQECQRERQNELSLQAYRGTTKEGVDRAIAPPN